MLNLVMVFVDSLTIQEQFQYQWGEINITFRAYSLYQKDFGLWDWAVNVCLLLAGDNTSEEYHHSTNATTEALIREEEDFQVVTRKKKKTYQKPSDRYSGKKGETV